MNRLTAAAIPVNFWTSLMLHGAWMFFMALIFCGSASISRCVTKNLRNFLEVTPKTHLEALSLVFYLLRMSNTYEILDPIILFNM